VLPLPREAAAPSTHRGAGLEAILGALVLSGLGRDHPHDRACNSRALHWRCRLRATGGHTSTVPGLACVYTRPFRARTSWRPHTRGTSRAGCCSSPCPP